MWTLRMKSARCEHPGFSVTQRKTLWTDFLDTTRRPRGYFGHRSTGRTGHRAGAEESGGSEKPAHSLGVRRDTHHGAMAAPRFPKPLMRALLPMQSSAQTLRP